VAYKGIGPEQGKYIESKQAFVYALERVINGTDEEKQGFVDWYFSGNWIESEDK